MNKMKRTLFFAGLLWILFIMSAQAEDSIRVSLAEWTFDKWYGGGVIPDGQLPNTPIYADRGTLALTARLGTEQMFGTSTVTRVWDVPTTGGYVRCNKGWSGSDERYYRMSGINTLGCSSVRLTSSHATSSSSQTYALKVQYRIGTGAWKDLFGPFTVSDVTESGISRKQVNNILFPAECNGKNQMDIRWLCTTYPSSSSTQFRLDNVYLTANVINPDPNADKTPLLQAEALNQSDWTVPSWTLLLSAKKTAAEAPVTKNLTALAEVIHQMQSKDMPYCVVASYNGNPCTNMGFAWYTNTGITGGQVQVVANANATEADFASPLFTVDATTTHLSNVNYVTAANDPTFTADLPVNTKRSYVSNKALVTGLSPNTAYCYRVGKPGYWSNIKIFRTAKDNNDAFSFIYITDTQANSNDNFECSSSALTSALEKANDPLFVLATGDLVESQGSSNSEWEYEQWFEKMQNTWSRLPVVATIGNHDASSSNNFFHHFNTDISYNNTAAVRSTMNGTVYSFVVGDALFMVVNHEDVTKTGYLTSLADWMTEQVNAHPHARWRIVCVHSGLFSGGSHFGDANNATLREALLPVYDRLRIDLSIQGHDHVYSVIGPVDAQNKTVISNAVSNVTNVPIVVQSNMNGKTGGTYDVTEGTLYFINNSASRKKYSTKTEANMIAAESTTRVNNYWNLFTGHYGQSGEPTYSIVTVSSESIDFVTYAINKAGHSYVFDQIRVIKNHLSDIPAIKKNVPKLIVDKNLIRIEGTKVDSIALYNSFGQLIARQSNSRKLSFADVSKGIYLVQVCDSGKNFNSKIVIN